MHVSSSCNSSQRTLPVQRMQRISRLNLHVSLDLARCLFRSIVSASRRLLSASQLKPKPSASMVGKSARSSITTEAWLRISDERPHNAAELPRTCLGVCLEQGCLLNVIKGPCARDFHLQPAEECFVGCCTLCLDQIRRPEAGTTLSSTPLPASQAYQSYPVLVSPAGCAN